MPSPVESTRLIQALWIVDNNGPESIGGGKPRVPLPAVRSVSSEDLL